MHHIRRYEDEAKGEAKGRPLSQYAPQAFPLRFVPDTARRYLYAPDATGQRRLLPDRCEFLVYRRLFNGLEAGDIFCRDSVRFRSFEDDLVDDERWQEKETLIANTGLAILKQTIRHHLAELEERLETRLREVNEQVLPGENDHFGITRRNSQSRWTLKYPRDTDPVNHAFFNAIEQVDIGNVMQFANRHCHFMEAFDHVLGRYAQQVRDDKTMIACLLAWASNMGSVGWEKTPISTIKLSPRHPTTLSGSKRLKTPMSGSVTPSLVGWHSWHQAVAGGAVGEAVGIGATASGAPGEV